jgi:hypothetical protein
MLTVHLLQKPFVCPAAQFHMRGPIRVAVGHVCAQISPRSPIPRLEATHKHRGSICEPHIALSACTNPCPEGM